MRLKINIDAVVNIRICHFGFLGGCLKDDVMVVNIGFERGPLGTQFVDSILNRSEVFPRHNLGQPRHVKAVECLCPHLPVRLVCVADFGCQLRADGCTRCGDLVGEMGSEADSGVAGRAVEGGWVEIGWTSGVGNCVGATVRADSGVGSGATSGAGGGGDDAAAITARGVWTTCTCGRR